MRNRVFSIRAILIMLLASLLVSIGFNFIDFPHNDIVCNIGYGMFGSSLVTLFLLIIDYQTIKKESYESFMTEYIKFLNCLAQISFIDVNEEELIYARHDTSKNLYWPFDLDGSNKKEWLKECRVLLSNDTNNKLFLEMDDRRTEDFLDFETNRLKERINRTILTFLSVSNYDHAHLDAAYARIHTFFCTKKNRTNIFNSLYKPAIDTIHEVLKESYHFKGYLNGEVKNTYVILCKIRELNDKFYRIVKNDDSTSVWAEKYDKLSDEFSLFNNKFYGHKSEKREHQCCYFSTKGTQTVLKDEPLSAGQKE